MTQEQLKQIADDPKAFLNKGYRAKERIEAKRARIASWQQLAESITAELSDMPAGVGPSKIVENSVCNIVDLQKEISEDIQELIKIEHEISLAINSFVLSPTYKAVLEMRYLNYYKWEEIAFKLSYTFNWTLAIHKRALSTIAKESVLMGASSVL